METQTEALARLQAGPTTQSALAAFVDGLPATSLDEMRGTWRGSGFASGHPMDGLLEAFGWYGKRFDDPETVHPLLFGRAGATWSVDPARVPMGLILTFPNLPRSRVLGMLFASSRPLLQTREPRARLRMLVHRGVSTATMIYDARPVADSFRTVDADTRLGVMDMRDMAEPFFFVLRRERA